MHWFQLRSSFGGIVAHLAVLVDWDFRSLCGEPFPLGLVVDVAPPGAVPREHEAEAVAYCAARLGGLAAGTMNGIENSRFLGLPNLSLRDVITAYKEIDGAMSRLQQTVTDKQFFDNLAELFGRKVI